MRRSLPAAAASHSSREAPVERGGGLGDACGTPAFFCSATGMKGLGRASIGQASSVSPLTHRQSKRRPADSSTPRIWIGTRRRFRLEQRVAAEMLEGGERFLDGKRPRDALQLRELAERLVPLGVRLELLASRARARRGSPAASSSAEKCRAHVGRAFFRFFLQRKDRFQMLPQERAAPRRGDELGQRDRRAERLAQIGVEPRAARHLGLGAAEEGRANRPGSPGRIRDPGRRIR